MGVVVEAPGELLLACTEALCTSRVGEVAQSWFLETCRGFGVLHIKDSEHPEQQE